LKYLSDLALAILSTNGYLVDRHDVIIYIL